MHWTLIVTLLVLAAFGVLVWANHQTSKQHALLSKSDVVAAIENVLSGSYHDEWDLFLAWPIRDSYLESIRQRCIAVSKDYSGEPGRDIASGGEAKLRLILEELQGRGTGRQLDR